MHSEEQRRQTLEMALTEFERDEFDAGARLTRDAYNVWNNIKLWFELRDDMGDEIGELQPLEHYEQYYRRTRAERPGNVDALMMRSDATAVAEFDALVDEFNNNLDSILTGGIEEAKKYIGRAKALIDSNKSEK
ncbi:MAG: hypothetical protein COV59_02255 [Candidatus Magasanikbacteria bacterium CG11_big_fil_rev_8_21_14_0_20_39_34]|uniref:Uncharacterized protein n=1 Tax=Candidatus Magasanikbacteria bacterium CG11_big_fil_rev_8_21_14_0_20_39_34 TaxID=1974653 RepID=A0A2H0N514_9BACT|nr:MAG: hypothetical protein COV59_02255 [Candidatus Magasanikbacteria bacterium CG11_big_fil_rev_8_21_14_0_20_39_34]